MGFILLTTILSVGLGYLVYDLATDDDDDDKADRDDNPRGQVLEGGADDDLLIGDNGDDRISGGSGDDIILGDEGNDRIFGEEGRDLVAGNQGDDRVFLGEDSDRFSGLTTQGDSGDDFVRGGAGPDFLYDAEGANTLRGDTGNDRIEAGALFSATGSDENPEDPAPDTLFGGAGSDQLRFDHGDIASGGSGADFFNSQAEPDDPFTTITDFDEDEGDTLFIEVGGEPDEDALNGEATEIDGEAGYLLTYKGVPVVFLKGASEAPEEVNLARNDRLLPFEDDSADESSDGDADGDGGETADGADAATSEQTADVAGGSPAPDPVEERTTGEETTVL